MPKSYYTTSTDKGKKMAAATKTVTILKTRRESTTLGQRLVGSLCVTSFIVIWLASCVSPILLFYALRCGYYAVAAFIVLVTVAAYAPWEPGAISQWLRWLYHFYHPRYYKGFTLEYEGDTPSPSDPPTFYAIHPHGAFCLGWANLYGSPELQHVRFCFAPSLYASPFFRLFSRCAGKPGSAARFEMVRYMRRGEHLALPPGGFEEATLSSVSQDRVFVKRRTGFIKLCLMHGLAVRPVYVFGERGLFANLQGLWSTRLTLNRFGVPTILIWGRWFFPLMPRTNVNVHIVAGKPIQLPKIEHPTKDDIAVWHGKYVAALRRLFDDHKVAAYGEEEGKVAKLEVW